MVIPTDRPTNQQGKYSAICLFEGWKIEGRDLQKLHWLKSQTNYQLYLHLSSVFVESFKPMGREPYDYHRLYLFWPVSWSVKGAKHWRGEVVRARVSTPFAENENSQFAYNLSYNNDGANNGDFD